MTALFFSANSSPKLPKKKNHSNKIAKLVPSKPQNSEQVKQSCEFFFILEIAIADQAKTEDRREAKEVTKNNREAQPFGFPKA